MLGNTPLGKSLFYAGEYYRRHVLVDGKVLPPAEPRPEMVPIFDDSLHAVDESFHMGDGWNRDGDAWTVDARDVAPNEQAGLMFLHKGIHDGWIGVALGPKHPQRKTIGVTRAKPKDGETR